MQNRKDREIIDLKKRIRGLEEKLYKAIEESNRQRDKARGLEFENSTLASYIQDLREQIADLKQQLRER